jgi:galactose mutarotase-like enzyme
MDKHFLRLDGAEARIAARGAELQSLRLRDRDLLWDAGPLWPRHAPLLFPIVGGLRDDAFRHRGTAYGLPRHGFARDRDFTWLRRETASCALELRDDPTSRAVYPFAFRLEVAFDLEPGRLSMAIRLENPGETSLPASLGLHPAFRWPLAPGHAKATHHLHFEAEEPGPLRRLDEAGLLRPEPLPSPIRNRQLALEEGLFKDDALLFLEPRSRGLRFEAEGGPALILRWEGFPHLGLWAKPDPGPSFLCIEPWEGHASPSTWDGEFADKPGAFLLPPGGTRRWTFSVGLQPRA